MKLRTKLLGLAKAIADAAERDTELAEQLDAIFEGKAKPEPRSSARPKNRRAPAIIDPVAIAREGEDALRARLEPLTLEQLRDIVADYRMDPGKLVMKWKDASRVRDRIVETSLSQASKGDAFRRE